MAGWVPKAALLLGRELKHVLIIRPQIRSLSRDAATMIKSAGFNFLKIDYDFGHPPFGLHYGYDVPLGSDGLPEWVDWSLVPGAVSQAKDQARLGICFAVAPVVSLGSLNFLKLPGPVVSRSPVVLSLQQVIDCMPGLKIGAGGNSMDVLDYIIRNGGLVRTEIRCLAEGKARGASRPSIHRSTCIRRTAAVTPGRRPRAELDHQCQTLACVLATGREKASSALRVLGLALLLSAL